MPHGSSEARQLKEDFIGALQDRYRMEHRRVDVQSAITEAGMDVNGLNTAFDDIVAWVSISRGRPRCGVA